ncbi:MAG: hypothetical protein OEZ33_09375, partial [Gammaproteobacteria bacterium]|nr:hypothetical protein [Gammaproteobacteria bacterium]
PLGNYAPPGHVLPTRHIYLYAQQKIGTETDAVGNVKSIYITPDDSRYTKRNLYAPGDMEITTIERMSFYDYSSKLKNQDYTFRFHPCREIMGYFIHSIDVAKGLSAELDSSIDNFFNPDINPDAYCSVGDTGAGIVKNCWVPTRIPVQAGQLIGSVGRHNPDDPKGHINAVDFGVQDRRSTFNVISPEYYQANNWLNTVCPFDYYDVSPDSTLGPREILESESLALGAHICGLIEQDVAGSLQGVWFAADNLPTKDNINENNALTLGLPFTFDANVFVFGSQFPEDKQKVYAFINDDGSYYSSWINTRFERANNLGAIYCYDRLFEKVNTINIDQNLEAFRVLIIRELDSNGDEILKIELQNEEKGCFKEIEEGLGPAYEFTHTVQPDGTQKPNYKVFIR